MGLADLLQRVADVYDDYLALGNRCEQTHGFRLVRSIEAPRIYDANYASRIRTETPGAVDALLEKAEIAFAGLAHRRFLSDPLTPAAFEARLTLDGYHPDAELEMLLEGPLRKQGPKLDLRLVDSDEDWETIRRLTVLDYGEAAAKQQRAPYAATVIDQLVERQRAKSPQVRTWLARVDGSDCAYLSSWPGNEGIGKIEDLFTHSEFRQRGIATGLIAHAVGDARERGADCVAIGARPDDTPKHMYRALGFEPCYLQRSWFKSLEKTE